MEQTAANEETLEVECPTRQLVAFEHNYYHAAAVSFYLLTFYRRNVSDGFLYNVYVFQALNAKIDLAGVVYCLMALLIIRDVF